MLFRSALAAGGVQAVVADLAGDEWHGQVGAEFDAVLNCVAAGGGGAEGYRRSYLEGMRSVLAWARRARVGTLVYTSSTSVYAQGGGGRVDESMAAEGRNETARILVETENLLRNGSDTLGFRWFILRLAGIYGPERHSLLDAIRAGYTSLPGTDGHRLNLAHRDDIVDAIFAAIAAPPAVRNEVFNVADDAPATKQEVAAWLAAELGKPAPARVESGSATARAVPDRIIANDRIKALLGWKPGHPSFREGYAEILSKG